MTATSLSVTGVLTHLIVTLLTPMFLATTGGDVGQARAAALSVVQACTIRSPMDLLLAAQMIILGLATLSSVTLSMTDDLSVSQILRLRGNAVSLHRASERCRAALPEPGSVSQDAPLSGSECPAERKPAAAAIPAPQRPAEADVSVAQARSAPAPSAQPATPRPIPPQAAPRFPPGSPDSSAP